MLSVDLSCEAVESGVVNLKCLFKTGLLLKERHCLAGGVALQARVCNVVDQRCAY